MSDQFVTGASSVDPLKSVADALETAVQAARDGAADARSAVDKAIPAASRFLARFVYTTSYTFSYGVVFPAVLIAKSIPATTRSFTALSTVRVRQPTRSINGSAAGPRRPALIRPAYYRRHDLVTERGSCSLAGSPWVRSFGCDAGFPVGCRL